MYRGLTIAQKVTGYNKAFLIDSQTRDRLIGEDPRSDEIIKPYLRGQDVKRWSPKWADLWMILLKSSDNYSWPWSDAGGKAESIFATSYPAVHSYFDSLRTQLEKRWDKGRFWWELRSCSYYDEFSRPKIVYQEIQFHPAYSYDREGFLMNNKVFMLPVDDPYLLAVLNSPLMWWYNWRYLPHMKDEALSPKGELMESLPIAQPTEAVRRGVVSAAAQLLALTKEHRSLTRELLEWLRLEFGIERPGQQLEQFTALDKDGFVRDVKKRRPRSAGHLTPGDLSGLKNTHAEYASSATKMESEMIQLERKISDLVNQAYGLTADEFACLLKTAPPRMPTNITRAS